MWGQVDCVTKPDVQKVSPDKQKKNTVIWKILLCAECSLKNIKEDKRKTLGTVPLQIILYLVFGFLLSFVSQAFREEDDLFSYVWIPTLFVSLFLFGKGLLFIYLFFKVILMDKRIIKSIKTLEIKKSDKEMLLYLEGMRILEKIKNSGQSSYSNFSLPEIVNPDLKFIIIPIKKL
ncbi:MAG: hypothetical protein C5S41_00090 [Candidatus Methanomarinus sp.]|nr:MAG: hypothetical protein C5S41_00090 [ANME-2 cluster archaeon]